MNRVTRTVSALGDADITLADHARSIRAEELRLAKYVKPPAPVPRMGECAHHWHIATPRQGQAALPAVCRICGAERAFTTSIPDELANPRRRGRRAAVQSV